jgi:tetratricopeptide (TPR) repeat protein
MAKKVSRKQLLKEPDEFITFSGKLIRLVRSYQKPIIITIGIAISIFLVFSFIRAFTNKAENNAFTLLNQANKKYESLLTTEDKTTALKEVEKDFEFILKEYSGYQAGKIAKINYANYCYQAGEYERAAGLYDTALKDFGKNSSYRNFILNGLGYSFKAKKDYEISAKYFEMIALSNNHILKDEALFNLAEIYSILEKDNKRTEALKTIISDYPESIYIELAKGQLSE